jgi:hypothetical protein
MLTPIYLNNELLLQTYEIKDVITERMLATKLDTRNLPTTQYPPQGLFSISRFIPQSPLQPFWKYGFVCLASQNLPHPHLRPPLEGEGIF